MNAGAPDPSRLDQLVAITHALSRTGGPPPDIAALETWETDHWRGALLALPLDGRAFTSKFQIVVEEHLEQLQHWWENERRRTSLSRRASGFLGFYLLTLAALHCSDKLRSGTPTIASIRFGNKLAAELSTELVADTDVRDAIRMIYQPVLDGTEDRTGPDKAGEWAAIDWDRLEFHRQGTTSMILTGRTVGPVQGRTARFALKIIILPFLTIDPIPTATRNYHVNYGRPESDRSPVVSVWASHDSWILMDFLPGRTLAECLAARDLAAPENPPRDILRRVDTDALSLYGTALLRALAGLEREGVHHDDLTPSNMIVEDDDDRVRIRFIDLGVNYLHTRFVTGTPSGESAFVAPEVRRDGSGHHSADVYSLGMLLIAISGIPATGDGTVPDAFYATSVGMARLIEDLTDTDPERRLLVTGIEPEQGVFEQLERHFRDEVEVLQVRDEARPRGWFGPLLEHLPGGGTVGRQRQLLAVRKRQAAHGGAHDQVRQARRLQRSALLCAVVFSLAGGLVVTWWSRDLGLPWQAKWFEWLGAASGDDGTFPFLDSIRAADSPIPDFWGNLPARLVTLSYALVSARLYLNVFAEVSPLSALPRKGLARVRTLTAEGLMRSMTFGPAILLLIPNLVDRDLWPHFVQAICLYTIIGTQICMWFAGDAIRRARAARLASVPQGEVRSLDRFAAWRGPLSVYLSAVLVIGTLISFGALQDELVYACFVTLVNFGIFYFKSAGTDAPDVRTGLLRAVLAAERLNHLESHQHRNDRRLRI